MKRHIKSAYRVLLSLAYRLVYAVIVKVPVFKHYQPVFGASSTSSDVTRGCEDRWAAMEHHLEGKRGSFLDIGCNIGYFSFQASRKQGLMAWGIEADHFNITCCNAILEHSGMKNVLFVKAMMDPEFVRTMPSFEVVNNLSVFHHWVKAYGADQAQEMMRELASKSDMMFFETGQPDEKGTKWADKLSFMGEEPQSWIERFLREIGFSQVETIGTFDTGLTDIKRTLFVAKKDEHQRSRIRA